jgi:hypothetical protein
MQRPVGVAVYKKDQYKDFLRFSEDREDLFETWEEWYKSKERFKSEMKKRGVIVEDVEVDIFDILDYCEKRNLPFNGKTRSEYVQEIMTNRDLS